jgi:hypothetical protein
MRGAVGAGLGINFRGYIDNIKTKPALPQNVGVFLRSSDLSQTIEQLTIPATLRVLPEHDP